MKPNIIVFSLLSSIISVGQDIIPTKNGDLKITPILHGTLILGYGDEVIYLDPYGGAEVFVGQKNPTLVLITDVHGDHHNQKTLDALDLSNASFVAPEAVKVKLPDSYNITTLGNGESKEVSGLEIQAIPMYNLPETDESRHPKGRGNGYIIDFAGTRVYISGDTEDIPEMRALKNIDVAFVCMNLPYTMDISQAADAVAEFKPEIVYPFHYRGKGGLSDVEKFKTLVNESTKKVEVRLRNWYPGM